MQLQVLASSALQDVHLPPAQIGQILKRLILIESLCTQEDL